MKKLAALLVLSVLCGNAGAQISKQTVSRAWQRMTQASGFPDVRINYEPDSEPNAWVMWQDNDTFTMHVTEGLMRILDAEDEIAGVLGHEIGHVKCGHYNKMVLSDTANTILGTNLERSDPLSQAVGKMHAELKDAAFSREEETEADDYGASLLKKAGYNPGGLYRALKKLGDGDYGAFSSHPATRDRLAHLAEISGGDRSSGNVPDEVDDIAAAMMGR